VARLDAEAVRCERSGRPFSLVMIDVDDFKAINDQHGHACGDEVLRRIAGVLLSALRAQDTVARWGGEEFLLLLPETARDGAVAVAEKLRAAVAEMRVSYEGHEVRCTVTMGVSSYAPPASLDECIRAADDALYTGKRGGKNTVVLAAA
jgi:diguanylate cyclase (GGDEF)-like protein